MSESTTPAKPIRPAAEQAQLRRRLVQRPEQPGHRQRMYDIIFEADCRAGRLFDVALLIAIVTSIVLVSLETVPQYQQVDESSLFNMPRLFFVGEWILTGLFTVEYALRLYCVKHPWRYAFSFWGVIDLVSILPSYLLLVLASGVGSRSFVMLRSIRLLRAFRVLKLWRMMSEADELSAAIWRSRDKIIVFLIVVLVAVTISGTLMYIIETELTASADPAHPDYVDSDFTSIPQAMYWAVVTMTTVGYGDVVPHTSLGKIISAILILLGYSMIIVPTGFVSAEFRNAAEEKDKLHHPCPNCTISPHRADADYCYRCGSHLERGPHSVAKDSSSSV